MRGSHRGDDEQRHATGEARGADQEKRAAQSRELSVVLNWLVRSGIENSMKNNLK